MGQKRKTRAHHHRLQKFRDQSPKSKEFQVPVSCDFTPSFSTLQGRPGLVSVLTTTDYSYLFRVTRYSQRETNPHLRRTIALGVFPYRSLPFRCLFFAFFFPIGQDSSDSAALVLSRTSNHHFHPGTVSFRRDSMSWWFCKLIPAAFYHLSMAYAFYPLRGIFPRICNPFPPPPPTPMSRSRSSTAIPSSASQASLVDLCMSRHSSSTF